MLMIDVYCVAFNVAAYAQCKRLMLNTVLPGIGRSGTRMFTAMIVIICHYRVHFPRL
jgi:hypothetical protein